MNRVKLFEYATPLKRLNYKVEKTEIWMKRDDLIEFYFGGNKVRLYEYIAAEILNTHAEKIITFGSIHSNHVRISVAVAAKLGIECDIIVLSPNSFDRIEGNHLLMDFLNVNYFFCPEEEAREYIDAHLDKQEVNYFFVPGGGHLPIAAMGYAQAYREMMEQLQAQNSSVEAIFLPTGTGTTQAGLIYGNKMTENKIDVIGVTVARSVERCKQEILCLLEGMDKINHTGYSFSESEIIIVDNGGIPYGSINERVIETMRLLAYTDGVLLDPIYNAKAFYQMENLLKTDYHNKYQCVLYLNTGGTPNIFTAEMARKVNYYECVDN